MATVRGTSVSVVCVGVVMAVSWLALPASAQAPAPRRGVWVYEKLVLAPERLPPACPPQGVPLSRPRTDYWVEGQCYTFEWLPNGLKVHWEDRGVNNLTAAFQDATTQWTAPSRTLTPGQPLPWTTSAETSRCRNSLLGIVTNIWFQSISPSAISDNVSITFPGSVLSACQLPSTSTVNGAPKVPEPTAWAPRNAPIRMAIKVNIGMRGVAQLVDYVYVFDENAVPDARPVDITRELPGGKDVDPPRPGVATEFDFVEPGCPAGQTNLALRKPARQISDYVGTGLDLGAHLGVDGVTGGRDPETVFHTRLEVDPWWEVDLGRLAPVSEVRLYNRTAAEVPRARSISLLFSTDGVSWTKVYTHGGESWLRLGVNAGGQPARYVRVQLPGQTMLHLHEVEVCSKGGEVGPTPTPSGACGEPSGVSGPASPAAATETTLEAARRSVKPGTKFVLPVWLAKATNLGSMNLVLRFDPAIVKPDGLPRTGRLLTAEVSKAVNPNAEGVVEFGFAAGTTGVSGTDTLIDLPLLAVGKAGSRTPIRLEIKNAESPENTPVRVARVDGTVEIVDCSVPPPPPPPSEPTTPPVVAGDCDGDGVLGARDALCALQMSVNLRPTDLKMDMDGNRRVTAADANIILRIVVGR